MQTESHPASQAETSNSPPLLSWREAGEDRTALWQSENGLNPPRRVVIADDRMTADQAYRLACEGTAMLWRGDFQNARQLLLALARRVDRIPKKKASADRSAAPAPIATRFHLHRQAQSQRARTLGMLLLKFDAGYTLRLRRAPEVAEACEAAYGPYETPFVASLRELLGVIGAYEWRKKGVPVAALDDRIHPHYGVFAPIRSEYLDLLATASLPTRTLAYDIGTGTGVLAAVLAKRGVAHVIATELDTRAVACARDNVARLGLGDRVTILQADLFPAGRAPLIVCNPPWLPARPISQLEHAVYDPDSRMLKGFLGGLREHLDPGGEGWLLLSDIAEHLGLRSRADLLAMFDAAGLRVAGKADVKPSHPRAADEEDALHDARAAEVTSLWRLNLN